MVKVVSVSSRSCVMRCSLASLACVKVASSDCAVGVSLAVGDCDVVAWRTLCVATVLPST